MKLNPQQAPLYGECLLTVQLCDEEIFEEEEDVEFYLLFTGSTQTHLSSTVRTSHVTLQAICPAHDCCESVQITLCSATPGQPAVPVGEGRFQFVQDLAYDMAQFLVSAAGRRDGLEAAMLLDQCEIPLQECEKLDQALARALHHLALPQGWSVLGTSASLGTSEDPDPHETLLHFAARRGLRRVALFLLKQPGGREALRTPNKQGATPASVAERRGHTQLQRLLSEEDGGQDANNDMPWQIHSGERVVRHHPRLNTYTLTVGVTPGRPPPSLQEEVEELRRLIGCHVLSQLHCDPPLAAGDRIRITETETGGAHLAGAQQRSQTGGKKGTHPKTYTGHEAEGDPPRSAPLIHGNGRGRSVGACGNHSRDYEVQEEEGVGLPAAWLAGDGERAPERNRVVRSRVKDHSSALINTPLHETANPLPHTSDTLCQERESCEEKEEEGEDRGERRLLGGKDWPAPCRTPQETDMGLAQSQEQSEMATVETEWHGKGDEAIDKARETVSRDKGGSCPEAKRDVETDDTNCAGLGLFSPGHPENTGEGEHSEAPGSAPPTTGTEELKSESNSLEQRKETAAGDEGTEKDRERAGGLGQAADAEHELIRHSQASGSPVMETGNRSMHDNSSSESPCGAKDRPCFDQSHPLNTEECLCQSGPQVKSTKLHNQSDSKTQSIKERFGQSDTQMDCKEELVDQSDSQMDCKEDFLVPSDSHMRSTEECIVQSGSQSGAGEQMSLSGPQLESTEEHHNQTGLQSTEEHIGRSDQQRESTEGCLNQSEVEICELAVADTKEVVNDQPFLIELARTEESSTDESLQIVAHIECQEVMLPDTSSCSSITETDMHQGGKACDVNERTPPSFLGVKEGSKSETLHPPEDVKSEVINKQQMEVPEKEAGNSLATEGILPAGFPCPSEGLSENHDKKQEEGANKKNDVTLPSREPHPHELSNQEPMGELRHIQFDGEDPLGDAKEQSRASEPKQEDRKSMQDSEIKETKTEAGDVHLDGHTEQTVVGSEVTEKETGESDVYSDSRTEQPVLGSDVTEKEARGDNAHSDIRTEEAVLGSEVTETQPGECGVPLDSQTGETLPQEQRDTLEHKGAETSDQEVLSLKDAGLGTKSCPTVGKEPTGNAMEKMGHETEVVDTECTADHTATTSITQNPAAPETVSETTSSNSLITKESNDPACSIGLPSDSNLELGKVEKNFEDSKEKKSGSSDRTHIPPEREEVDLPAEDQVDSQRRPVPDPGKVDDAEIHKDDSFLCYNPFVDPPQQREQSPEPQESLCLTPPSAGSSVSASRPDSGSDGDGFFGTDVGEDGVFRKDPQVGDSTSEVSISCSSNEDAVSMGPPGSSTDGGVVGRRSWNSEEVQQQEGEGRKEGDEEEEEKDHVTEVPARSSLLRCSERSPSPFRRHSWGPGKTSEGDISQCSLTGSLRKGTPTLQRRSYSLEGLTTDRYETKDGRQQLASPMDPCLARHPESEERGSLVSLTEEDLGSDQAERCSSLGSQTPEVFRPTRCIHGSMTLPLMKSVSLLAINQRELDGMRSFSSVSGSLSHSISEEDPGPLRAGVEGKSVTKVGRTFSYLRNKMYKKTKEKEKEKNRVKEKEREAKEKEKRTLNGHIFSAVSSVPFGQCHQCHRVINSKEASYCTNCNAHVHKSCRETLPACTKIKMKLPKQQFAVPDSSTLKSKSLRERPWSILTAEDDGSRRHSGIKSFSSTNLSKSISISNIAGPVLDEIPLKGLRYLSQSTDSLHKTSKVNESTESLTDEGTDMMDSQLMGEFEVDARELEADSWSFTVDRKYLKQFKKDMIKRQDVIYELMQTEMHHVRTLRIVAEVYSKGLLKEVQLEAQTVERVFPALDDLLDIHSGFLSRILDRRKESRQEGGFLIRKIGDILVAQFSGSSAERMKKVYGKFCSRHKEALSFYKELHAKDKRFQAFIKKKMSSPVVRRLGIPECILLVTQRITKYPVLLQRMLQHTKEGDEDHVAVTQALGLVKEVIAAVDSKVNDQEKKQRLREVYRRTDSRSIMRMKSGQMFAREDLLRGRKLLHDGPLQLKTSAGRLKDVQALLLSDVFVFLQEKDQKYIFASLDQRATVLSLQKLIIREVANEEKGLFLITAGIERPEMVEVHASSKEERNTWIQLIQEAVSSM
ncbi:hypothetical protein JZ751_020356 [Albula glossodonta]|uniref:A-kinase anchor protein 13 n=1 Tax=Albula glossodonta TaxID=121402 RepID=A0A8T2NL41_9TELE|nr:hypothetical protein JZ751_020356 [Albula glossodonta]